MALNLFTDFDLLRPTQLLDQHFGLGLHPEDLFAPLSIPHMRYFSPLLRAQYYRPWKVQTKDTGSTIKCDENQFQVNLDVQQFAPDEIKVKVVDDSIVIEGKHEEKQDEHGFISRQFQRRYVLPKGHDSQNIQSKLSSDGVLSITVPRTDVIEGNEKVIPITRTGEPHKAVKASETADKKDQK